MHYLYFYSCVDTCIIIFLEWHHVKASRKGEAPILWILSSQWRLGCLGLLLSYIELYYGIIVVLYHLWVGFY